MSDIEFDLNDVQPTMRKTVMWLRNLGCNTTDSGDGKTNVALGMEGAFSVPNVFFTTDRKSGYLWADRIWSYLRIGGLDTLEGVNVELSYSPKDNITVIGVFGIDDAALESAPTLMESKLSGDLGTDDRCELARAERCIEVARKVLGPKASEKKVEACALSLMDTGKLEEAERFLQFPEPCSQP